MECLSWLVALSPLLGQGLAVVPSRRGRGIAEGEVAGQLRRQSHSWELGADLGEGARAGQDRRGWGVHRERENTLPFGQRNKRKGQEKRQEKGVGKGHSGDGNSWRKHNLLGGGMVGVWVLPHPASPP